MRIGALCTGAVPARASSTVLVVLLLCLALANLSHVAATERVANFAGGGSATCVGNCSTTCPCATLQQALDAAQDGDEVWLLPPANGAPIACEAARTDRGVTLRPHPAAVASGATVVLDCNNAGRALWLDGRLRHDSLPRATLADLTFTRGKGEVGGCVQVDDMAVSLLRCRFIDCLATGSAGYRGGGVSVRLHNTAAHAAVSAIGCEFVRCRSLGSAGALALIPPIQTQQLDLLVLDCTFLNCTAADNAGAVQANLLMSPNCGVNVTVARSRFIGCAAKRGGAVYVMPNGVALSSVAVTVADSQFQGTVASIEGGAVVMRLNAVAGSVGGTATSLVATVTGSLFNGTHAGFSGGALVVVVFTRGVRHAQARVLACTFLGATAEADSGAISIHFDGSDSPHASAIISGAVLRDVSASFSGAVSVEFSGRNCSNASVLVTDTSMSGIRSDIGVGACQI